LGLCEKTDDGGRSHCWAGLPVLNILRNAALRKGIAAPAQKILDKEAGPWYKKTTVRRLFLMCSGLILPSLDGKVEEFDAGVRGGYVWEAILGSFE
jgi:hypothetical protein